MIIYGDVSIMHMATYPDTSFSRQHDMPLVVLGWLSKVCLLCLLSVHTW